MTEIEENYLTHFKETIRNYYPISDESFNLLRNLVRFQKLRKGEMLLNIGEISKQVHFICKGIMTAYFIDKNGNTYNKNIFLENQFAGSTVSRLLNVPSGFAIQAIENTTIININYKQYKELIYGNDELKNFYIAYLEKNWVIDKEQREISLVMENATTRYKKLLEEYPDMDKRVPLQYIASHLGITSTQLSRIRKNFKKIHPNQHM